MANLAFPPIAALAAAFGASLLWALPVGAYQAPNKCRTVGFISQHESGLDAARFVALGAVNRLADWHTRDRTCVFSPR